MAQELTQARLQELFLYEPNSGLFTRRAAKGKAKVGSIAGSLTSAGYVEICIDCQNYYAHRLAWLYVHGELPAQLDHRDRVKSNNSIGNLRLCSSAENMQNLSPRRGKQTPQGVSYAPKRNSQKPYRAQIVTGGTFIGLGAFATELEAHTAYLTAKKTYHSFTSE